jgi:hypothetical protein
MCSGHTIRTYNTEAIAACRRVNSPCFLWLKNLMKVMFPRSPEHLKRMWHSLSCFCGIFSLISLFLKNKRGLWYDMIWYDDRQCLGKHVLAGMDTHATIEKSLDEVLSVWSILYQILNMQWMLKWAISSMQNFWLVLVYAIFWSPFLSTFMIMKERGAYFQQNKATAHATEEFCWLYDIYLVKRYSVGVTVVLPFWICPFC